MLHRPSSERPLPVPAGQQLDAKQQQQVRTLLRIMRHGSAVGNGTAKGALLASEPGTGKTPMSITVANA
jgi:Holliday junction resolvasome RuvABC ATP-dependent DNA helicase subunit